MIRAVLDTNVLASGFVHAEPPPGQILLTWLERRFELVTSQHILDELARTFEQPYFSARLSPALREANVRLVRGESTVVDVVANVRGVATHPEDDLILGAAVSAGVDYLVTGDAKLLAIGTYRAVKLVSPRAFLGILAEYDLT